MFEWRVKIVALTLLSQYLVNMTFSENENSSKRQLCNVDHLWRFEKTARKVSALNSIASIEIWKQTQNDILPSLC